MLMSFTHLKTKEDFIKRANERHNNKYDYSKVEFPKRELLRTYTGARTRKPSEYYREAKITIICPDHGEFVQTARKHIEKSGCRACAIESRAMVRYNKEGIPSHILANPHITFGNTVVIKKTNSNGEEKEMLFDVCDIDILHFANWYPTKPPSSRTDYCYGQICKRMLLEGYNWLGKRGRAFPAHRLILSRIMGRELKRTEHVDHINHNGLDNRRENLRIATPSQNHGNIKKQRGVYTSIYKGVCFESRYKLKWLASIKVGGVQMYIGRYPTEEEAARAYDKKAKELFGEFAYLNFPDE